MKRKNEKVPELDDIIFENRNKIYGAYRLRKQYKSTAAFSVFGGAVILAMLVILLSFSTEKGKATAGPGGVILIMSDPLIPKVLPPPVLKLPKSSSDIIKNLKPEVTEDTAELTRFIPTTEELIATGENRSVNDTNVIAKFENTEIPVEEEPRIIVQEMPEFPGGETALFKFINDNIRYPQEAQNLNVQGRVILKFVIKSDGSVDKIEVMRGIDQSLDNEAVRVIRNLPKFRPGKQNGIAVPVWFTIPVLFKIENN